MHYHKPQTFQDAARIAATATGVTRFLAGGTDVLVQLRGGTVTPDTLIDLKAIAGVKDITATADGGWRIGIAVSGIELGRHAGLVADWPGVVEGMQLIGSTQVQGRATLAGNLCNASPAADSVPGLVAAGASVTVVSPTGSREVAVLDIPASPGRSTLKPGEIVAAITLPPRGKAGGDAYLRFIPRTEMDIAVVGCAVSLTLEGDRIASARVALGAVAPTVLLVAEAAAALVGTTLDDTALTALGAAVTAASRPISDRRGTVEFRKGVIAVLAGRAARIAYDRAMGVGK